MSKKFLSGIVLIVGLVFCTSEAGSAFEILFSRYSVNDGLASNFVNCVWQDPRGLIWVGTDNGLQRYDGSKFISFYQNSNQQKLPALAVHQILRDAKSTMWIRMGNLIGTFNTFNYTFKEVKVITRQPVPPQAEYYLRRDFKGNLLLAIHKVGIFVYNERKKVFEENRNVLYVPLGYGINHAFEDRRSGDYWLSTDRGLLLFDYKTKSIKNHTSPGWNKVFLKQPDLRKNVLHLHIDKQFRYWIITRNGPTVRTYCYDETKNKFTSDTAGLNTDNRFEEVKDFKESRGVLWAYGYHFLKIYGQQERGFYKFYSNASNYGIKFNVINHIFEDREKNVWIATDNGLYAANVIRDEARHGVLPQLHEDDMITAAIQTSSHLLLGTSGHAIEAIQLLGSNLKADPSLSQSIYHGRPKNDNRFERVWDMHDHSSSKSWWFTCQDGRLIKYDPVKRRSLFLIPPVFNGATITQVVEDKFANLWFGTYTGKLIQLNSQSVNSLQFENILDFGVPVKKLYVDRKNTLWVATAGRGLFSVDVKTGQISRHVRREGRAESVLSSDVVRDVVQLNDSIYYVAAGNLDILNTKTGNVRQLTLYDGLPFTSVSSLQVDREGDLWLSTVGGVCTYDYKRNFFRRYDQKDGLITTTSADNLLQTSLHLSDSRVLFAGGNNFVLFNPDLIKDKKRPDNVTITDFKLFNQTLPVDSISKLSRLSFGHNQNSITIEFATLNYNQHNKLKYDYMLSGADNQWVRSDGPTAANYAYLPPGDYVFMVRAVNSQGLESPKITTLSISIEPPFWQTWWFVVLATTAVAALVYWAYRVRLQQLMQVQKVRERVARDLHDDMGSTLSTINILSEMAKVKINADTRTAGEYISKISDNSSRMMEAMDDIVWSIKPSNDSIQKITARMREFAAGILEPKDIDYYFELDEKVKDVKLDMEARRDLFLIFKEAINNLAKYSRAQKAHIQFYQKDKKLILKIEDNGEGFLIDGNEQGNGLLNMKKRADRLKGTFSIESKPGAGTKVCLELPIT
jgi:signal transduction histidine kinase/ligand-binding sensor domain-containing protein